MWLRVFGDEESIQLGSKVNAFEWGGDRNIATIFTARSLENSPWASYVYIWRLPTTRECNNLPMRAKTALFAAVY